VGQHGAYKKFTDAYKEGFRNPRKPMVIGDISAHKFSGVKSFHLDLSAVINERERNVGGYYYNWFVPPETGRYRFHMVCETKCRIYLATCPNTISPKKLMINLSSSGKYLEFFRSSKTVSEWVHLTKGEPYYMEAQYILYKGDHSISTGVEFEQSTIKNHHQAVKEIQEFRISTDSTKEQHVIEVKNPDSGSYKLIFKSYRNTF
jgi:hypothetical protein